MDQITDTNTKYQENLGRFFSLIGNIVSILADKGYDVPSEGMINLAYAFTQESIKGSEDLPVYHAPLSMFLRLNPYAKEVLTHKADFFEKNISKVFNLPTNLAGIADKIFKCKKHFKVTYGEDGKITSMVKVSSSGEEDDAVELVDLDLKQINMMFIAVKTMVKNGIKILYLLSDPSGFHHDDEKGYKVYKWRHDPKTFLSFYPKDLYDSLGVDKLDLSEMIHVWGPQLPDPK